MPLKVKKDGVVYPLGGIINGGPATAITYNNTTSGLASSTVQGAIDEISVDNTFTVESTDWTANQDSTTSTDYPYVAQITTAIYQNDSRPIWQMNGVGTIPTSTERESIAMVLEAVFLSTGVTLYATDEPTVDLVLEVKGR